MITLKSYLAFLSAFITILLVIWGIYALFFKAKVERVLEYWEDPNFKTDTIIVDVEYPEIKIPKFPNQVPPRVVIQYTPPNIEGLRLQVYDSLIVVIDSLKQRTTNINPNYIKLYPSNHKLVYGDFTLDTLRLDLLTIDGSITTEKYPVNFFKFNYQYLNNELRAQEITRKQKTNDGPKFTWYGTGGYGFTEKSPLIGTMLQITEPVPRILLFGEADLTIERQPNLNLELKVGYRIK